MTTVIQKFHKTFYSRTRAEFEHNFKAYRYDAFYRYLYMIPFQNFIAELTNGAGSNSGTIYTTATLVNPNQRKLESIEAMQLLSFYIRPDGYGPQVMKRLSDCPNILFAGYTSADGIRFGVPVSLGINNFHALPPDQKKKIFLSTYSSVVKTLRSDYEIAGIKSSPEILECMTPIKASGFYCNEANYQILQF